MTRSADFFTILHGFDKRNLLHFTFEGYTVSVQKKKK